MNKIVNRLAKLQANRRPEQVRAILALVLVAGLLLAGGALAQSNGGYDLSWWTVDGGGGSSEGGEYRLAGTAGQADAGVMGGGDYLLAGGFLPGGKPPERYRVYLPVVLRSH